MSPLQPESISLNQLTLALEKSISGWEALNFSSISIFFLSSEVGLPICYSGALRSAADLELLTLTHLKYTFC